MSLPKKITLLIVVIAMLGSIVFLIASSVSGHIKTMYEMYKCFDETFKMISSKVQKSTGNINLNKSFNLKIKNIETESPHFSSINFSNDKRGKRIDLSVENLKIQSNVLNMNGYISNRDVGFYFDENPEFSYSASSENFRTKWNDSIYSKIYQMPDFVPDDLNYDKISRFLKGDNLFKSFVALSFSNLNAKPEELVNNVRVYKYEDTNSTKKYRMTVSREYIKNILEKLEKSSEKAYIGFLNPYLSQISDFFKKSTDKNLIINFTTSDRVLRCAETSVKTENEIYNITLTLGDTLTLAVKNLSSDNPKSNLCLARLITEKNSAKFIFLKQDSVILSLNTMQKFSNVHTANLSYLSKGGNAKIYNILLDDKPIYYKNISAKNIYSMPITELLRLYNTLRGID